VLLPGQAPEPAEEVGCCSSCCCCCCCWWWRWRWWRWRRWWERWWRMGLVEGNCCAWSTWPACLRNWYSWPTVHAFWGLRVWLVVLVLSAALSSSFFGTELESRKPGMGWCLCAAAVLPRTLSWLLLSAAKEVLVLLGSFVRSRVVCAELSSPWAGLTKFQQRSY
jgi:hypothetical protein